jgi:hypothetical protein
VARKVKMSIIDAVNDQHLFKPLFRNLKTWASWISFLKALFALPMSQQEIALYQRCTGREKAPGRTFREAWVPTGRRSGKSFIAALIAVFLACFRDYTPYLSPGESASILILAADRQQAAIIFKYVRAFLNANRMLSKLIENERAESIDLSNRVTISVVTCSYRSVRGFTAAAIICDEIAFWRSDDGRNPATEVLRALRPSMGTIPDSLLLAISSPYSRSGPLWDVFNRHHGQDDSDVLCWQAATTVMNPTISQEIIDRDLALDPEAARAEWLAEFRSDLEAFLPESAIQAVTIQDRFELAPVSGAHYSAFVDPSGGRNDAAALAIAHVDNGRVILDLARKWPSPHDPAVVVKEEVDILKTYHVSSVRGDRYAGGWPEQEFLKHGIGYRAAEKDKSSLYLDFLPLVLSGKVELLDNKHLFAELRSLERRTRKGGRDLVDHPPRQHDDLCNAVAGVSVGLGVLNSGLGMLEYYRRLVEKEKRVEETAAPPCQTSETYSSVSDLYEGKKTEDDVMTAEEKRRILSQGWR